MQSVFFLNKIFFFVNQILMKRINQFFKFKTKTYSSTIEFQRDFNKSFRINYEFNKYKLTIFYNFLFQIGHVMDFVLLQ